METDLIFTKEVKKKMRFTEISIHYLYQAYAL